MNLKRLQLQIATDKKFLYITDELEFDKFTEVYNWQKININFTPGKTKYLFFKVQILDFNIDEQIEAEKHFTKMNVNIEHSVKVVINFGKDNFNLGIRKQQYQMRLKKQEENKMKVEAAKRKQKRHRAKIARGINEG